MTLKEVTPENVGALCRLFRVNVLREKQSEFAERHIISKAGISYFERGISISLYMFLAYVEDGLEDYMNEVNQEALDALIAYNRVKKQNFIKLSARELGAK